MITELDPKTNYHLSGETKKIIIDGVAEEPKFISGKNTSAETPTDLLAEFAQMFNQPNIFGKNYLNSLKRLREELKQASNTYQSDRNADTILREIEALQQELRESLLNRRTRLFYFFSKRLESTVCGPQLINLSQKYKTDNIEELLKHNVIPPELLETMLEEHISKFQERNRFFQEQELPTLLAHFKERAERELRLPKEELEQRLSGMKINLIDYLTTDDDGASYGENIINIPELAADIEHATSHELVHAIHGLTLRKKKPVANDKTRKTVKTREGLRFNNGRLYPLFVWLDEGKTEELNLRILGKKDSPYYKPERKELEHLYEQGLPREYTDEAYLENYNPEDPTDKSLVGWRKMIKALDGIFSGRGIRHLRDIEDQLLTTSDVI